MRAPSVQPDASLANPVRAFREDMADSEKALEQRLDRVDRANGRDPDAILWNVIPALEMLARRSESSMRRLDALLEAPPDRIDRGAAPSEIAELGRVFVALQVAARHGVAALESLLERGRVARAPGEPREGDRHVG